MTTRAEIMAKAEKARTFVNQYNIQMEDDEHSLLKCASRGYESLMQPEIIDRLDDIEMRYGIHGKGLKRPAMPLAKGTTSRGAKTGVKVHYGAHGEVYELSPDAKVADVIKSADKPPVEMDRWLAATMLGDRCEDRAALEYAIEAKSLSGSSTGVMLPSSYQGEWIDLLRSQMVLNSAGMTTVTMDTRTVTASRQVTDPAVSWRAEGAPLTVGEPTFELQNLVAKSVAVRVQSTAELALDSPNFGAQLARVMTRALAQEVDRAGLVGSGQNDQPRGIINVAGIGTVPAVGVPANYSKFVNGLQRLMEGNVDLEKAERNAIMSPRTWGKLENLTAADGQPLMRPKSLERMVFRPTNSIPNNLGAGNDESVAILGDFSDLVLGVRMEATVEALRLTNYGTNLILDFIGWTRVDFLARRAASFIVLNGIK